MEPNVDPPRAFPRPLAKGELKVLAWPNAGDAPIAPSALGCPNVGVAPKLLAGGGGRLLAPRVDV